MPPTSSGFRDDTALRLAIRAGDEFAIAAWYEREHPIVYRLALGLLADASEAEDLTQDAMLHLLTQLPNCKDPACYVAWRTRAIANLCRDRLRKNATRRFHENSHGADRQDAGSTAADVGAQDAEFRELLTTSLRQLSERERAVFVLRDLEERSTTATAAALQITDGTVRSLLSLARRRLRDILGPILAEPSAPPTSDVVEGKA